MSFSWDQALALANALIETSLKFRDLLNLTPSVGRELEHLKEERRDVSIIVLTRDVLASGDETCRAWLNALRTVTKTDSLAHQLILNYIELLEHPSVLGGSPDPMQTLGIEIGQKLADRYEVTEYLGGKVVRAFDVRLQLEVAVRVFRGGDQARTRVVWAARFAATRPELAVPVTDIFTSPSLNDAVLVVKRLCSGGDLRDAVRRVPQNALPLFLSSCLAVHDLHDAKYLHLNLSCGNLLVDDSYRVHLTDCRFLDVPAPVGIGQTVESIPSAFGFEISPEIRHGGVVRASSDVYSLARAFQTVLEEVPDAKVQLGSTIQHELERATSTKPEERHVSALEFMKSLESAADQSGYHPTSKPGHETPG